MWNRDTAKDRVSKERDRLSKETINVQPLTREMDLTNLSTTDVRIVHGSHFYLDITNIREVIESATLRRDNFKPLHRYMHVLRVELRRIMQQVFDGDKIQVQGAKFHGLLYKPYDNDETLAWHAVLIAVAMIQTVRTSLPKVFPDYPTLTPTIGMDIGNTLVANVGARGNRELISIGSAANHAAKILGTPNTVKITASMWKALSADRQGLFVGIGDNYNLDWLSLEGNEISDAGFNWSTDDSVSRMQDTVDALPLSDIESHGAEVRIDVDSLGPKHFKRSVSGSVFVDIDGYTSMIDSKMGSTDDLVDAVKLLHSFRHELHCVTSEDFEGVSIQHQGDRLQALIHLPPDDADRIRERLAEMCVSYNSSVEEILNDGLSDTYHVAIGAAYGKTIVVRSGTKGDLDASCFGDAVLDAETFQLNSAGNEMRISKDVFSSISNDSLRAFFRFDSTEDCYKAVALTWSRVEDAENSKAYSSGAAVVFSTTNRQIDFKKNGDQKRDEIPLKNTRNWGC